MKSIIIYGLLPIDQYCPSPDLKSNKQSNKNLERLYNWVVGGLVVCLVEETKGDKNQKGKVEKKEEKYDSNRQVQKDGSKKMG